LAYRLQAVVLTGVLCAGGLPTAADARQAVSSGTNQTVVTRARGASVVTGQTASIVGSAWNADNSPIPHARLRLRNVASGRTEAATIADGEGQFTFVEMPNGTYVVELVSESSRVLTVSTPCNVTVGETAVTFVRLGTHVPWFTGFFGNAALAVAAAAAATGLTALAPEEVRPVSGRQ
jgi:hypothetical protein